MIEQFEAYLDCVPGLRSAEYTVQRGMCPACATAPSHQPPAQRFAVGLVRQALRPNRQPPPHRFAVGPAPQRKTERHVG